MAKDKSKSKKTGREKEKEKEAEEAKKAEKEKKKKPWKLRYVGRLTKLGIWLDKSHLMGRRLTGDMHNKEVQDAYVKMQDALGVLVTHSATLPDNWKPKGSPTKPDVGLVIELRPDLTEKQLDFCNHFGGAVKYKNAEIVTDSHHDWIVKCTDGVKRIVRKKYVRLALKETQKEEASSTELAPSE